MRIEELSTAIANAYLKENLEMGKESATEVAWTVLSHFGYGNTCLGNNLQADERELFYQLEDLDLLKSCSKLEGLDVRRGAAKVGGDWRVFQWELNEKKIQELQHVVFLQERSEEQLLYEGLPDSAFRAGGAIIGETEKKVLEVTAGGHAEERQPSTKEVVLETAREGLGPKEIAEKTGFNYGTVGYYMSVLRKEGKLPQSGRKREAKGPSGKETDSELKEQIRNLQEIVREQSKEIKNKEKKLAEEKEDRGRLEARSAALEEEVLKLREVLARNSLTPNDNNGETGLIEGKMPEVRAAISIKGMDAGFNRDQKILITQKIRDLIEKGASTRAVFGRDDQRDVVIIEVKKEGAN